MSGSTVRSEGSFTPYHRPIRSETPRSSHSTLTSSLRDQTSSPLMAPQDSETGVIAIGMALGSPTQPQPPPPMAVWPYHSFEPTVTTTVEAQSPNKSELSRSKSRKWGIFRSRSKKGKQQQDDLQPVRAPSPASHHVRVTSTTGQARASTERKPKTLVKSRTEPMAVDQPSKSPLSFLTRAISKDDHDNHHNQLKRETFQFFHPPSPPLSDKLLDVDIPDVTMERYSVMFGHLLENRSTASLLARRQANRDKIKAIREGEGQTPAEKPEMPGCFPTIMISGSSIPPMRLAPTEESPSLKPVPQRRSYTVPSMLASPTETDFEARGASPQQVETPRHVATSIRRRDSEDQAPTAVKSPNPRPMLISKYHQRSLSEQSMRSAPSPMTFSPASGPIHRGSGPPSGRTWKSAHPPLSGSTTPSIFSPPATQSISSPSEVSPTTQDPVEMSIARQISVSRQQRVMLGPLQRSVLESKRINETRSSTPHLVDPTQDPDSPVFRQGERAVVEGV
ncbi:hypothetical protein L249_4137 [Ophiocordyceps polyrhachis-furcata BCC 54312]|uniref:Uncharacterized protein n=1 Tax=Ophiocordyceps polyrhachis-furcata BCC 54312 TaxID=1330021 RepID=A0A367L5P8_9HYPO|nr:hypothetical protein L249_4137 [Ophiocordyceps polyrhachis-furcata BCC 54312]